MDIKKLKLVLKVLDDIYHNDETDREDAAEARDIVQNLLNHRLVEELAKRLCQ